MAMKEATMASSTTDDGFTATASPREKGFTTRVKGIKDAVCSNWMRLACYSALLMQRWRDKIIDYKVQRWIVAFALVAVNLFEISYFHFRGLDIVRITFLIFFLILLTLDLCPSEVVLNYRNAEYEIWCCWMVACTMALVWSFMLSLKVGRVGNIFVFFIMQRMWVSAGKYLSQEPQGIRAQIILGDTVGRTEEAGK